MRQQAPAASSTTRRITRAALWCLATWCASGLAWADQTDPSLEALFGMLKSPDTPQAARSIEAQIWSIWSRTADDAVNAMMAEGTGQLASGDADAALDTFSRVIQAAPGFAEGWNKRATTLYLMGRYAESVADIGHVLALEPRHFGALSGLAMCDVQLHRTQAALDALLRAQTIDPDLPDIQEHIDLLRQKRDRESI